MTLWENVVRFTHSECGVLFEFLRPAGLRDGQTVYEPFAVVSCSAEEAADLAADIAACARRARDATHEPE